MLVVEHNGATMMARVSVLRALNRQVERVWRAAVQEVQIMQTLAAEALKTLIITSVVIVAGPVLALVSASDVLAKVPDGCRGVQLGMVKTVVISHRVANRDNARFVKALRQELSRRNLTRARIKECAPQWDLIISKFERCAASGDTECRFSQQEVDEINKAPDAPTAPP